jgi:uncharacterized protein (TIGR02118 family)
MATLVSIYRHPSDAAAFDDYYRTTHLPLAKTIPGLRSCVISRGAVNTPQGPSAYHRVAVLGFDCMESLAAGLSSPQGQATAADLANFAQAGVEVLVFDSEDA